VLAAMLFAGRFALYTDEYERLGTHGTQAVVFLIISAGLGNRVKG